jgi:hypothetical protein
MFDSLDEQMKKDEKRMVSNKERYLRWAIVAISTLVVFGALIAGVHWMP